MKPSKKKSSPISKYCYQSSLNSIELIQYIDSRTYCKITCTPDVVSQLIFILHRISKHNLQSMNGCIPIQIKLSHSELQKLSIHPEVSIKQLRSIHIQIMNEENSCIDIFSIFENITIIDKYLYLLIRSSNYKFINHFINNINTPPLK